MGEKILIVDDEPNVLRLIGYALHVEGYEIVIAQTGVEALNKVQTEKPDLVILDIILPDISGIKVCQQIRDKPGTASLPIIMLSAKTQVSDKIKGLEAGADEYITKPVDPEEMVARVRALLERTRRLRKVPTKRGKVLGFIGAKGGVGTTTVALNVALALVKRGKTVIALELRSYFGTFAPQLGLIPAANLSELLELEPGNVDERQLRMHLASHPSGLRVLFGLQRAEEYKDIEPEQAEAVVMGLADMANYLVIDLPCHPSPATRAVLKHCDSVVVVVTPEPVCVAAGKLTLELLKLWGVGGSIVRAAVVNNTGAATVMTLPELRSQLSCEIVGIMPPASDLSMKALKSGKPLVLSEPDSLPAIALNEMTDRLVTDQAIA